MFGFHGFGEFVSYGQHGHHSPNYLVMGLATAVGLTGLLLSYLFYSPKAIFNAQNVINTFKPLHNLFSNKWYFDELYGFLSGSIYLVFANLCSWFDKNVIDGLVNLTAFSVSSTGSVLRVLQQGRVQSYLTIMTFCTVLFFAWLWMQLSNAAGPLG